MTTSGNGYALPNPGMVDPYPIESTLLKDTSSPLAMALLYRSDRALANEGYQDQLQQAHDQAHQQLLATIQNNQAERLQGYMGHPGGVALGASATPWVFGGANSGIDTALKRYAGPDEQLQIGNAAKPGSEVAKNLSDTSYQLGGPETDFVTGLKTNPAVPVSVQAAQAKVDGQKPPAFAAPMFVGTVNGQPVHINVPTVIGASPDETFQRKRQAVQEAMRDYPGLTLTPGLDPRLTARDDASPNSGGTTSDRPDPSILLAPGGDGTDLDVTQAPGVSKPVAPEQPTQPPAPSRTNLQPNKQAAPDVAPEGNTTPGQLVANGKLQQMAQQYVRGLPADVKEDILKEMKGTSNGGNAPLYPGKNGGFVLKGRSGKFYPTPIQVTP